MASLGFSEHQNESKLWDLFFYRWFVLVHIGFPQRRKHCSIVPAKSSRQLRKNGARQPLQDDALHFQDLAMQLHFPHRITCGSGMLADSLTMNRASMILSHVHTIPNHELVNVIHGVCVK